MTHTFTYDTKRHNRNTHTCTVYYGIKKTTYDMQQIKKSEILKFQ